MEENFTFEWLMPKRVMGKKMMTMGGICKIHWNPHIEGGMISK